MMFVLWPKPGPKLLGDACFTAAFEFWNDRKNAQRAGAKLQTQISKNPLHD
jgi:hypothetical protein